LGLPPFLAQRVIALYRAMGFVVEGTLRASARAEGRSVDQYMMAKLLPAASR